MKRLLTIIVIALTAAVVLAACGSGKETGVIGHDQTLINTQVKYLQSVEPLPKLKDSGALKNLEYQYTAEADPNKIWYLVTQGMNGNATGSYTIRGPVIDQSDQTTNSQQLGCVYYHSNGICEPIDEAEPDGVYQATGSQGEYAAVTTTGALLRWAGFYTVSDQPFKLTETPSLQIDETKSISSTDTSKTENAKVPPKQAP